MAHPVDEARKARARQGEPHRPRPNMAKTKCLDCGRAIVKGERRPSGLYWRHVGPMPPRN